MISYEAICGMAQKAGAVITPVVARHGCAEDLPDEPAPAWRKKNSTREARARRAEHHAPKYALTHSRARDRSVDCSLARS